jgi:probable HAF family extracellular repeat protein
MKTESTSRAAFFNSRLLIGFALCSVGLLLALAGLSKSVTGMIAATNAANPAPLINQPRAPDAHGNQHHHYRLIDMGTFGGPESFLSSPDNTVPALNSQGTTVGGSATPTSLTATSNPFVCGGLESLVPNVNHAFEWRNGAITDLGSLAGPDFCSLAGSVNARGEIVGTSEINAVDPLLGVNEIHGVTWKNGEILDVGTLGGTISIAVGINHSGQVIGGSLNTTPDPYSIFDFQIAGLSNGTQTRAFLFRNGLLEDLGTLGGPDAFAGWINEQGWIAGVSYINSVPNPSTGFPTEDPFLFKDGKMQDLGSLGGVDGFPQGLNNRGQVIGGSSTAAAPGACFVHSSQEFGNPGCDPFLWDPETGIMIDLSTSTRGGTPLSVQAINDAGEIVGAGAFGALPFDAYLWTNGVATDLGNLGDCFSLAFDINSHRQIIGRTFACDSSALRAFLWENGSIADLDSLIRPGSSLQLVWAIKINERGEIAGIGVPPGVPRANVVTQGHAFLLIPCDEHHPGVEGCDYSLVDASVVASPRPAATKASRPMPPASLWRNINRFHFPGHAIDPRN